MKPRWIAGILLLFVLLQTAVSASEQTAEQTAPAASLPSSVQPQEDENSYIKTTPDGIRYSIKEDGSVRIEGCRTTAVQLQLPSKIQEKPVNEIAPAAFQNESGLIGIVIPDSITVIGESAFESCKNLTSVTLPNALTCIPYRCFAMCDALRNVTLPENLNQIENQAFLGCTLLGTLEIPRTLTEIGVESFFGCERLVLSCNGNEAVLAFAKEHRIPTNFFETDRAQLLLIFILSVIGFFGIFLLRKRNKKKAVK